MARIPESEIERLKLQISIVRLVEAAGIALKPHGKDLVGRCPFHDDKTPSLVISPKANLWHCLGACQAGGSPIDWVMRWHKVSFRHAVELLQKDSPTLALAREAVDGRKQVGTPATQRVEIPVHESPAFRRMGDQDSGTWESSVPEHESPRFRTM